MLHYLAYELTCSLATPSRTEPDFSSTGRSDSIQFGAAFVPLVPRPLALSNGSAIPRPAIVGNGPQAHANIDPSNNDGLQSPFRDCVGTFGLNTLPLFDRHIGDNVNGYIKFSRPNVGRGKQSSTSHTASISDARVVELDHSTEAAEDSTSQSSMSSIDPPRASSRTADSPVEFIYDYSSPFSQSSTGSSISHTPVRLTPSPALSNTSTEVASMGAPKMLPSQYGYEAKMDDTDRRFWMFCKRWTLISYLFVLTMYIILTYH